MKKGRASSGSGGASSGQGERGWCEWRAGLISLSPPRVGGQGRWEFAPVAHLLKDRQAARGVGGAFGSEGLVAGEHVPDRFGEPAGEVDLRGLGRRAACRCVSSP